MLSDGDTPSHSIEYVYATILIGAARCTRQPRNVVLRNASSSVGEAAAPNTSVDLTCKANVEHLNRTICFQQRLRELSARWPLLVLHNFDVDVSAHFDLARRTQPPAARSSCTQKGSISPLATSHFFKFNLWSLTEFKRIIYLDSDVYMRVLRTTSCSRRSATGPALSG
jgi:hypothetical protein